MPLFQSFRVRKLVKQIEKLTAARQIEKAPNLENIKRIGLVLDASRIENQQFAIQFAYLQEVENKDIQVLGYLSKIDKNNPAEINTFSKKDINWYYKPLAKETLEFMGQKFDLLINLSHQKLIPLEYICAVSNARYIVGNGTNHMQEYYDCLIQLSDSRNPQDFMDNLQYYLGKF